MKIGGIILCGGKSTRMGKPKAMLPFGGETMLARVVRLLGEVVDPVVVVAAAGQTLPTLPDAVSIVYDEHPDRGPLEGLKAGLKALAGQVDAAYVTGCDVPLMSTGFVRQMIAELGEDDLAVPVDDEFHHPLAAVYRTTILPQVESLLETDRRRPYFLFEACKTRRVPVELLQKVDPGLHTLMNLNQPADYQAALRVFNTDNDVRRRT